MKSALEQFVRSSGTLPSLPTIFIEIRHAVDNPNSSIRHIAAIIQKDQGLASRLLRLANSAFYGFPRKVETIDDALHLIGLREMRDLALATTVIESFKDIPPHLLDVRNFWKHCIACATAGGLLAQSRHEPNPERFFVAGLLHDIGRLVLVLRAPEKMSEALERSRIEKIPLCQTETAVFGFDHAALGGALLEWWKLPPALVDMVRWHHKPSAARYAITEASVIQFADFLSSALGIGNSGQPLVPPFCSDGWIRSHLDHSDLAKVMDSMLVKCAEISGILQS